MGIRELLEHVGIDTSNGIWVGDRMVAAPIEKERTMNDSPIFERLRQEQALRGYSYEELCKPFTSPLEGFGSPFNRERMGFVSQKEPLPLRVKSENLKTPAMPGVDREAIERIRQRIFDATGVLRPIPSPSEVLSVEIETNTIASHVVTPDPAVWEGSITDHITWIYEEFYAQHPNAVIEDLKYKPSEDGGIDMEIVAKEPHFDVVLRMLTSLFQVDETSPFPRTSEKLGVERLEGEIEIFRERKSYVELRYSEFDHLRYMAACIADDFPGYVPTSVFVSDDEAFFTKTIIVKGIKDEDYEEAANKTQMSIWDEPEVKKLPSKQIVAVAQTIAAENVDPKALNDVVFQKVMFEHLERELTKTYPGATTLDNTIEISPDGAWAFVLRGEREMPLELISELKVGNVPDEVLRPQAAVYGLMQTKDNGFPVAPAEGPTQEWADSQDNDEE